MVNTDCSYYSFLRFSDCSACKKAATIIMKNIDNYIPVALRKMADLIRRDDFVEIKVIGKELTVIEFKDRFCDINLFGKVTWDYKNGK